MRAVLLQPKANHQGWLYPLLIIAAISVIILSAIGAAALAGWLPRAESANDRQSAVGYQQNVVHYEKQGAVSGLSGSRNPGGFFVRAIALHRCRIAGKVTP